MKRILPPDEVFAKEYAAIGPTKMAKKYKTSPRNVMNMRSHVEARLGLDMQAPPRQPTMLITDDRVEVKLEIEDGVVLVAGDQHYWPGTVPVMHRAYCVLSKRLKPYAQIWNGDAFDGSSISRFPSIGWESKPTVKQELDTVQARSAEVIKSAPAAKRVWCAGNHDLRLECRLAAEIPEFRGMQGIHLKDHFPEWTPAWFVTINGGTDSHTEIRHREKGGIHAGFNNTKESGVTLVTGHDHRAEVLAYNDRRGRRYGVRHGMTADSCRDGQFVNYLEGRTTNWQSAFAMLTYKGGRLLQPELCLKFDEETVEWRGELIRV